MSDSGVWVKLEDADSSMGGVYARYNGEWYVVGDGTDWSAFEWTTRS